MSTIRMKNKKAQQEKLMTKMQSLDDVFQQSSKLTTPSIQVPPEGETDILLTPLSRQACQKHGINPEVLRNRSFESFREDNSSTSEEIQHMRHEAYAKRRFEMMKLASEERNKLKMIKASEEQEHHGGNNNWQHAQGTTTGADNINFTTSSSLCSPSCSTSAKSATTQGEMIRAENRRLEKIRTRQKKELLMILQAEGKMTEIQRELKEREDRDRQAEEARQKARVENAKRAAEDLRLRELRRKAAEDAEEELTRIKAKEMYEREQSFLKEKEQQKKELRKRASIEAQEKERQKEAHRLQMAQKQEMERLKLDSLIEERRAKENEIKENLKLKQQQDRATFAARKQRVAEGFKAKQEAAKQMEQKRKLDFEAKLTKMEMIHQAKAEKNRIDLEKKQKEIEFLSKKREQQLKLINEAKESKKESYIKKIKDHEETVSALLHERELELKIVKEGRELMKQLKLDNVERLKRSQEYKRQETLKTMSENESRAQEMLRKKKDLLEQRKRATREAKIQKDKIVGFLEQSKMGGGSQSIQKLISAMESATGKPGNADDDGNHSPKTTHTQSSYPHNNNNNNNNFLNKEDRILKQQGKKISITSHTKGLEQRVNELKKKIGPPPPMLISVQDADRRYNRRGCSDSGTYKSPYLASVFPKS